MKGYTFIDNDGKVIRDKCEAHIERMESRKEKLQNMCNRLLKHYDALYNLDSQNQDACLWDYHRTKEELKSICEEIQYCEKLLFEDAKNRLGGK